MSCGTVAAAAAAAAGRQSRSHQLEAARLPAAPRPPPKHVQVPDRRPQGHQADEIWCGAWPGTLTRVAVRAAVTCCDLKPCLFCFYSQPLAAHLFSQAPLGRGALQAPRQLPSPHCRTRPAHGPPYPPPGCSSRRSRQAQPRSARHRPQAFPPRTARSLLRGPRRSSLRCEGEKGHRARVWGSPGARRWGWKCRPL